MLHELILGIAFADDEPADGPDYYFVVSGFASVEFFSQLAPLGISAKALCKVRVSVYNSYVCMYAIMHA